MTQVLTIFSVLYFILPGNGKDIFNNDTTLVECSKLHRFQYKCSDYPINPATQQSVTCSPDNSIIVKCETSSFLDCDGKDESGYFNITVENGCEYRANVDYSTAVLLSIFVGFLGIDRFYLGYYALGIFKMFTCGGLLVMWLVDVILITLQLIGPADGSAYFIPYYGPRISPISRELLPSL